jgi:hypothetical protein
MPGVSVAVDEAPDVRRVACPSSRHPVLGWTLPVGRALVARAWSRRAIGRGLQSPAGTVSITAALGDRRTPAILTGRIVAVFFGFVTGTIAAGFGDHRRFPDVLAAASAGLGLGGTAILCLWWLVRSREADRDAGCNTRLARPYAAKFVLLVALVSRAQTVGQPRTRDLPPGPALAASCPTALPFAGPAQRLLGGTQA